MRTCPNCNAQIENDSSFCVYCGTNVRNSPMCPHCGNFIAINAKFCTHCGAKLENVPLCPFCGKPLKEGSKFCVYCGNKVDEKTTRPTAESQQIVSKTPEQIQLEAEEKARIENEKRLARERSLKEYAQQKREEYEQEKRENRKTRIVVVSILLGLSIIGLVAYFSLSSSVKSGNNENEEIEVAAEVDIPDEQDLQIDNIPEELVDIDPVSEDSVMDNDSESEYCTDETEQVPLWIVGTWKVNTVTGEFIWIFEDNNVAHSNQDNYSAGTWEYRGNEIVVIYDNESIGTTLEVDNIAKRIGVGNGYWMTKIDNSSEDSASTEHLSEEDSDETQNDDNQYDEDEIVDEPEENAQFPGGEEACYNWLSEHIKYPIECQEQGIQGRVVVAFVVNCDGSIVDINTVRTPDPNLAKEAERVVSEMPKWIPAHIGNKTVRSRFNLPIMFRMN